MLLAFFGLISVVVFSLLWSFFRWGNECLLTDSGNEQLICSSDLEENQSIAFWSAGLDSQDFSVSWLILGSLSSEQELNILQVPCDLIIPTEVGDVSVSDLWRAGLALNPPDPLDFVQRSLENRFAVFFDSFIIVDGSEFSEGRLEDNFHEKISSWDGVVRLKKRFVDWVDFSQKVETNLSRFDLWALIGRVIDASSNDVVWIDLSQDDMSNQDSLVLKLSEIFSGDFSSYWDIRVGVYNATSRSGLAGEVSLYFSNLGMKVLEVSNYASLQEESFVVVRNQELFETQLIEKLRSWGFGLIKESFEDSPRMDLEVVLGEDWTN